MKVIKNVTIMTSAGKTIPSGSVKVENGKIREVGGDMTGEGFEIIDGEGGVVTPGLIDPHTHLGIDEEGYGWEGADFNETSSPVTPHMRAIDGINPWDRGLLDASEAGITTVHVLPGSANVVGGVTTVMNVLPRRPLSESVIRVEAGLKCALGENPKAIHGKNGKAPVTRMGVAAMLREQFVKAENYRQQNERDIRMEPLLKALDGKIPVFIHAHRADDILTALRIKEEFGLDLHIEHVTEGHLIADELRKYSGEVAFTVGPTLSNRSKVELGNISWETYKELADHEIPFAMTTDHPVVPISHLRTSMIQAAAHGLDKQKALDAITIEAAKNLGVSDAKGSIEPGKDADLVLWSGDPFDYTSSVLQTFVKGERVFQKNT